VSAIAAVLGDGDPAAAREVVGLLAAVAARGREVGETRTLEGGALGVARFAWEEAPGLAGPAQVFVGPDGTVVVADAAIYYVADFRRALAGAGVTPPAEHPSALIWAAWKAWGREAPARLEGDFAFVLWDAGRRELLAARDFHGSRPLFFADRAGGLALSSGLRGLAALEGVSRELNRDALAEEITGISSACVAETPVVGVGRLPAGWSLRWSLGGPARLERHWEPPLFERGDWRADEAPELLRSVLGLAVRERVAEVERATVWMSGGYDSTAVYAAGRAALGEGGGDRLQVVSMSYPPGDPGREDELIEAVAARWEAQVRWVRSTDLPPLPDILAWAASRDEPAAHAFTPWNAALASATVAGGARVALNGNGGDQFFGVSPVYLADLLRSGQWRRLRRDFSALRLRGAEAFLFWAVVPALAPAVERWLDGATRGRLPRHYLEEPWPAWLPAEVAARLEERRARPRRRPGESHSAAEAAWYLTGSFGPRTISSAAAIVLSQGAEARSPLYDGRVLRVAAMQPRDMRNDAGERKKLLRLAVRGLLPDSVTTVRQSRTGLPGGWLRDRLLRFIPDSLAALRGSWRLADLGLADPARLMRDWERYRQSPESEARRGGALFRAISVDAWLRQVR